MPPTSMQTLTTKKEETVQDKSQLLAGLLISFVTILIFIGLLELAGYLWERKTAQESLGWTLVASRRMPLVRHGDEERPYYLFEPNKDYNWEGIDVHINSRGLRTEEVAIPKPDNTYRILNLGDSVAFGWEVAQNDTYGKQLEQILNEQNNGLIYEVVNAGVPGWNLAMERNYLLQEGFTYEPDLIVLDITLVNDIYGKGPSVSENYGLFSWLRDHTYVWPFLSTQARFFQARSQGPEAIPVLNPPQQAEAYFPLEEEHPIWDTHWETLLEMHDMATAHQAEFVIVAFPTAFQLNSAGHPLIPQQVLAERSAAAGLQLVDLTPIYQQVCTEAGVDACEGYENYLFADVWMHPNELGHRLVADALYRR